MKPDKIELYKVKVGKSRRYQWRWRRIAPNGEVIGASTEAYVRRIACLENAKRQFVKAPIVIQEEKI